MPIEPVTGLEIFGPINERTTVRYTASLLDVEGSLISNLDSLHVEVFDLLSKTTLRSKESVIGAFNEGEIIFDLSPSDSVIVDQRRDMEDHIVRFDYVYNGQEGHHAIIIRVRNLWKLG